MIQFFGLHVGLKEARGVALGRDFTVRAESQTAVANVSHDATTGTAEVPCSEWVRSGCYCLRELFFKLPVAARRLWGVGLSGPPGWTALDLSFEPLLPVRLTGNVPVLEDIRRWLEHDPRLERRVSVILSPKDYFRFAISRGLATDVTFASQLGLLEEGRSHWSRTAIGERGIDFDWFPPVFDSQARTGRLSEEGIEQTSLPAGGWVVAGADTVAAAFLACANPRGEELWRVTTPDEVNHIVYTLPHLDVVEPPQGWARLRSSLMGCQLLRRLPDDPASPEATLETSRGELEAAGFRPAEENTARGKPELGASLLALIGSEVVKRWDKFYRRQKS